MLLILHYYYSNKLGPGLSRRLLILNPNNLKWQLLDGSKLLGEWGAGEGSYIQYTSILILEKWIFLFHKH